MTYVSLSFIILFCLIVGAYFVLPFRRYRYIIITIGNLLFCYYAGGKSTILVMIYLTVAAYFSAKKIGSIYQEFEEKKVSLTVKEQYKLLATYKEKARKYLIAGLILVFAILFYVKIGRFLSLKTAHGLGAMLRVKNGRIIWRIFVPMGLSFYTLSLAGYLLDVFWRKTLPENNILLLFTCISFFPTVVEGPICRFSDLISQFRNPKNFDTDRIAMGLQLMMWGFFKKLIISERFLQVQNRIFRNVSKYGGLEIVVGVLANVVVDYADFSGCIDIARGAAQVLGIELPENFRQPFFSKNASEFWRRWHMTLGEWFKDYLYMPIARSTGFIKKVGSFRKKFGKRAGQIFSTAVPLLIVWTMTGLWHGTGFDYLLWGLYWGTVILLSMIFEPFFIRIKAFLGVRDQTFGYELFQMLRTFILFSIGRMITATGSVSGFILTVKRFFSVYNPWILFDGSLYKLGLNQRDFMVGLTAVFIMWGADILSDRFTVREKLREQPLVFRWIVLLAGFAAILVFGQYGLTYTASSFMYGNF